MIIIKFHGYVNIKVIPIRIVSFNFIYTYYFCLGDVIVGHDQRKNGDKNWGNAIILLVLLPNLLFVFWFTLAQRKRIFTKKKFGQTWMKIILSGMVQVITVIRYDINNFLFGKSMINNEISYQ